MHCRCQIQEMKDKLKRGIYKWEQKINDFHSYLPMLLWVSGGCAGDLKLTYTELEMTEILKIVILSIKLAKLNKIEQIIQDNMIEKTVPKLASLEATLTKDLFYKVRMLNVEGRKTILRGGKQQATKRIQHKLVQ